MTIKLGGEIASDVTCPVACSPSCTFVCPTTIPVIDVASVNNIVFAAVVNQVAC